MIKNIKEQEPTEIRFRKKLISDNQSISSMSVHGTSTMTVPPDRERIPSKEKKRNLQKFQSQGIK